MERSNRSILFIIVIVCSIVAFLAFYPSGPDNRDAIYAELKSLKAQIQDRNHHTSNDFSLYLNNIARWQHSIVLALRTVDGLPLNFLNSSWNGVPKLEGWFERYSQGGWETDTFNVYRRFIDPDDVVVDFGAWIGVTALYAGRLSRNVYALEPDPVAFEYMAANLYINPDLHERVRIEQTCIWIESQTKDFYLHEKAGSGSSLVVPIGKKVTLSCLTLRDWFITKQLDRIDFIKMDTEGAEEMLIPTLPDFFRSLPHVPDLWLSIHHTFWKNPNQTLAFVSALRSTFRACYWESKNRTVDFASFGEDIRKCPLCAILCTNIEHHKIKWEIDLGKGLNSNPTFLLNTLYPAKI